MITYSVGSNKIVGLEAPLEDKESPVRVYEMSQSKWLVLYMLVSLVQVNK